MKIKGRGTCIRKVYVFSRFLAFQVRVHRDVQVSQNAKTRVETQFFLHKYIENNDHVFSICLVFILGIRHISGFSVTWIFSFGQKIDLPAFLPF